MCYYENMNSILELYFLTRYLALDGIEFDDLHELVGTVSSVVFFVVFLKEEGAPKEPPWIFFCHLPKVFHLPYAEMYHNEHLPLP